LPNYIPIPITVKKPEGMFYSFISQADADSKVIALIKATPVIPAVCIPDIILNYIQENGGTSITIGFTAPVGSSQYVIRWNDITYHQYTGEVSVSTTSPVITLPAAGRTYTLSVNGKYGDYDIGDSRLFTFESVGNVTMSQNFIRTSCGCPIAYTIHAGTYTADTQALANKMAQDDINANGLAYVNKI
jgi:hypothetical protein